MFKRRRPPRPRCKYCDRILRQIKRGQSKHLLGTIVFSVALVLVLVPEARPAGCFLIALALVLRWPAKRKWVCEYCGVVYDDASLRGAPRDKSRAEDQARLGEAVSTR